MDYYISKIIEQNIYNDNYLNLFLKIPKYFPKDKSIYYFFLFFKLLPLIVVTHDWNISSHLGISFWLRKFTLAEIIADIHHIYLYYSIVLVLFFLVNIVCFLIFYLKSKISFNGKLFHKYKTQVLFLSFVIFYIFYATSQFYFSIFIEVIFNEYSKNQNKIIYYIIIFIEGIVVIFTFLITFLMGSIIIHEPFFINSLSPLLNELGSIDIFPIFLILQQIVVQLEFSLKFKQIFLVKLIARGVFCIFYIRNFFNYNNYYYKYNFYYLLKLLQSCCFISCIIEFVFCYDYSNELKVLQKDSAIIVIKLILELLCGIFLNEAYFYIDNKKIKEEVKNFSYKNIETFNYKMIKFLNMLYFQQNPNLLKSILQELNISIANRIHNPLCKERKDTEKCYYCHIYKSSQFILQMNYFINYIKKKNELDYNCIKIHFSLLYNFFENEISHYKEINFTQKNSITSLIFVVTYILVYERNFYKCLFILQKIQSNSYIQKSLLASYQITFFKHKLIRFYKNDLNHINGKIRHIYISENEQIHKKKILNCFNNFKTIERIFYIEAIYKHFLFDYIKIMNNFNDDFTSFFNFKTIIDKFNYNYKNAISITKKLFTSSKCGFPYQLNKFYLFFTYYRTKVPKKIRKAFDYFFNEKLLSLIDNKKNIYIIVLKIQFLLNETIFKINYATDNLIQKLKYTNKDFNALYFNEIYAKTFYKSYKYIFEKNLLDGTDIFKLSNLCLIDKNKYVILFDLEGVPIYKKHGIELYIKLTEAKEQLLINKNKNSKIERPNASHFLKKSSKSNFCGSSFLFTNKLGKIYNLSRGFEDFFFLNTNVLDRYNINIMELLKIDKLDSKGTFRKKLKDIFDNIYNIYLREVGQLGEDPFSQVILQINEFKKNTSFENNTFNVDVNYEEKSLTREGKRIKYYYLFVLTITLEEKKETFITKEIIQMFQQPINYNQSDMFNDTFINSFLNNLNSIDKNCRQYNEISKKLINIKKLSKIILNKFFKIKTKIPKIEFDEKKNKIKDEEINQSDNYRLLKIKKKEKKEKKVIKKFLIIKYSPILISIIFIILFIIFFYLKITRLKGIKKYFRGSNHALMLIYTSIQMIIKILEIQIKNNELQPDIINNNYNNSYEYHIETLNNRMRDYLSFKIQFLEFYSPFTVLYTKQKLLFLTPQNYSIPDINGTKKYEMIDSIMSYLNIFANNILFYGPVKIIYNNSEYYFNETMIEKQNMTKRNYYKLAESYTLILDNFAKFYAFYNTELLNSIIIKIYWQIDYQYSVSRYYIICGLCYTIFIILFFFIFLNQTKKIIKETFHIHIILRFFNNYIIRKTLIILDYFDSGSEINNYKQLLEGLEIIEDNEEKILIKQVYTDVIYDYNIIRIKPYSIKSTSNTNFQKNYFENSIIQNNEIMESESKKRDSIEQKTPSEKIKRVGSIKERKSTKNLNNLTPIILRPKSSFMKKNTSTKKSKDHLLIPPSSISITKQLMSPTSSNNLMIQTNQSSLNNTNATNTNTNNTLNTNSTNVNNEISLTKSITPLNSIRNRRNSFVLLNEEKNRLVFKRHHTKIKNKEKKDEEEEEHNKFNQGGFKLLNKPYLYVKFFIELNCFLIIFLGILMFEILTSKKNNRMFKSIVQTRNNIFQQFNFVCEMFIIYILSVLNNKEIIIPYIGNDLSYYCDETLKYKDNPLKNVYDFLNLCYPEIKEGVDNISLGKIESKLENTRKFLLQINSNDFCNSYSNFLYQNTLDSTIPDLTYLHDLDLNDLINECQNVGNVFNTKGLTTAFDTIIQVISYEYKDFILDKNRTEKSNLERLNNVYIQNIQVELERVLRKVTICYYIVFNWDYNNIEKKIINDKKWIYSLMVFVIVIIAFLYTYNIYIFSEDLKKLQFFKDCIVNSILFL